MNTPTHRQRQSHRLDVLEDAAREEAISSMRKSSSFGNRFIIGKDGDRDEVCRKFECEQLPEMDVSSLVGCDLACFCAPHRCHGDSILLKANHRVLVFGGRDYADRRTLYRVLDDEHARRKIKALQRLLHHAVSAPPIAGFDRLFREKSNLPLPSRSKRATLAAQPPAIWRISVHG